MHAATSQEEHGSEVGALYLAIELSNKNWKLGFAAGMGQKPRQKSMPAGDVDRLWKEVDVAKSRFGLPVDCQVVSCYEAGRDGFWLHHFLTAKGVKNVVVDSASIEVNRRARRAKADGLDVAKLLTMLVRYHLGEKKLWAVVNVPTGDEEDRRHPHREISELKRERTRRINRLKGLLANQGIKIQGRGAQRWDIEGFRMWDGAKLPEHLEKRLQRLAQHIEFIDVQIAEIEAWRTEQVAGSTEPAVEKVRQLTRLKGIGRQTAWVYGMEFFGWRTFRNRRQVGSLAGLTPTPYQSGETSRERGISKAGNRHVRAMAIQTAWSWLRFQPDSQLSQWYMERFGGGTSRLRRIGIVALARKILVALWRYLDWGEIPEGAQLKA